jgi:DinB superfamily
MSTLAATATSLRDAMTAYVQACGAPTEREWVRQGPPRGWSMAETTEHVATTNTGIHRLVGALRPVERGEAIALDDREINVGMFRGDGAPPGPGPTGTWTNADEAVARFEQSMQGLIEHTNADESALRAGVFEHSVFGLMDGVQWLLFAAVHTNSHLAEITELRAPASPSR